MRPLLLLVLLCGAAGAAAAASSTATASASTQTELLVAPEMVPLPKVAAAAAQARSSESPLQQLLEEATGGDGAALHSVGMTLQALSNLLLSKSGGARLDEDAAAEATVAAAAEDAERLEETAAEEEPGDASQPAATAAAASAIGMQEPATTSLAAGTALKLESAQMPLPQASSLPLAAAHPRVASPAPFAYQPTSVTPETIAALISLAGPAPPPPPPAAAAVAPAAPAAPASPQSDVLRWFLQSVRISGDTLFKLRMDASVERLLHDSIKASISDESDVSPDHVEVIAAANVTLPLAFRGVDWRGAGAAAALRAAMARLAGGFSEQHIHVSLVGAAGAGAAVGAATAQQQQQPAAQPLARRLLQQQPADAADAAAAAAATAEAAVRELAAAPVPTLAMSQAHSPVPEQWVTVTFADMSISNATFLLDALGAKCGANGSLSAHKPVQCAPALQQGLSAAGAVPDAAAYGVRLRDKPASTITLTLGLGMTADDISGGAEAKATSWLARGELASFFKRLNLTATPLQGLAGLLPALGNLTVGSSGGGGITVTIDAPSAPPPGWAAPPAPPGGGGAATAAKAGYVAGISVACGIGLAALAGVGYVLVARHRDRRRAEGDKAGEVVGGDGGGGSGGSAGGRSTSTGGLGGRRQRRQQRQQRPRVYNQQKDLTAQLTQARVLQARARQEEAEDEQRQEEAAARGGPRQIRQSQQRQQLGGAQVVSNGDGAAAGAGAGGAGHSRRRSSGGGSSSTHHLERGDSVMSAARFELDEEAANTDGSNASSTSNPSSGSSGSSANPRSAPASSRRRPPAAAGGAGAGGGAPRARSLPLSAPPSGEEEAALVTRRGAPRAPALEAGPSGSAQLAGGRQSSSSGGDAPGRRPWPNSSVDSGTSGSEQPRKPAAARSGPSSPTGSAPSTPCADITIRASLTDGLCDKPFARPVWGRGGADEVEEEPPAWDVSEPLPARPVTGRLPTPFAACGPSFSDGE